MESGNRIPNLTPKTLEVRGWGWGVEGGQGERRRESVGGRARGAPPALATAWNRSCGLRRGDAVPNHRSGPYCSLPRDSSAVEVDPVRDTDPAPQARRSLPRPERSLTLTAAAARGLSNFGHLQQKLRRQLREEPAGPDSQTQGPFCRLVLCVL